MFATIDTVAWCNRTWDGNKYQPKWNSDRNCRKCFLQTHYINFRISGKIAHCKKNGSEKYRIEISFEGIHEQRIDFVKGLTKAYHHNKNEYRYRSASKRKTAVI